MLTDLAEELDTLVDESRVATKALDAGEKSKPQGKTEKGEKSEKKSKKTK